MDRWDKIQREGNSSKKQILNKLFWIESTNTKALYFHKDAGTVKFCHFAKSEIITEQHKSS